MDAGERLDALEIALKNELQEREFYLENAARTANAPARAMFLQIADDELEHYERLKLLRDKWAQTEQWPESLPLTIKETRVRDVLQNVLKQMDKVPAADADDLAALNTAVEFEAKGVAHYSKLRDSVSDPKQKQFFDLLAKMEEEHYRSLRETQEFLTDPASWYRMRERHGLDGG